MKPIGAYLLTCLRGIVTRIARTSLLAGIGLTFTLAMTGCAATTSSGSPHEVLKRQAAALAKCHTAIQQQLKTSAVPQYSNEQARATNFGFQFTGVVAVQGSGNRYSCSADENGANDWEAADVTLSKS